MNEEIDSSDDEVYIEKLQSDTSDSGSSVSDVYTTKRKTVSGNYSDEDSDENCYSMNWVNVKQ